MLTSLTSPNIETICEKEPVWALFRWWGTCWLIAAVLSLECAKTLSAAVCHENVWEANTSPQKANGHTPVYIKKNQREKCWTANRLRT